MLGHVGIDMDYLENQVEGEPASSEEARHALPNSITYAQTHL